MIDILPNHPAMLQEIEIFRSPEIVLVKKRAIGTHPRLMRTQRAVGANVPTARHLRILLCPEPFLGPDVGR